METDRPIEGIFTLENGDVYVEGWVPAIIKKEDFGGLESVPVSVLAFPHLGRNGDKKWYIFSSNNLVSLSNAPSAEAVARAEILAPPQPQLH